MRLRTSLPRVTRIGVALGAASALVIGFSGSAHAADTTVNLNRDGHKLGYMKHEDEEPDSFRVCDTRANGHGVTGGLYMYAIYPANQWVKLREVSDSGDAGCGSFEHDLHGGGTQYMMKIKEHGTGEYELKKFEE